MTQVSATGDNLENGSTMRVRPSRPPARTCAGVTTKGDACRSRAVGTDGFCNMHSPTRKVDPVEMGRRGGKRSGEIRLEQGRSVRDRIREKVEAEAERIWLAFDAGLRSDDERVRVGTAQAALAEAYGRPAQAIVGDPDKPVSFELISAFSRIAEDAS